ncbi:MBL fold metallo-hydrolase [Thalassobaculum fulvum]|uniref:MBL fold metallo-hydrolase n=1 Tax=Thalassobaculum fulvum TaxID=1633335 RepID=A0A919CR68_9PROT|nr:MBL fold metallo-hydrolase [Thalassobaculum fulvum]GHD57826.1 MBL fold metallo-hydrolase [Thalassobaculum fulvum]
MQTTIQFLGGAGTVTGSKYLLQAGDTRVLVDCGLFQGFKQLRLRNWARLPVTPSTIDAVVLTHAHIDHSGYLPKLVHDGFRGPIFATDATRDLCDILLPDAAHLQEKDAEFANRHGFSKHRPALPLYTRADADAALELFETVHFGDRQEIAGPFAARFDPAGHILGAAIVTMTAGNRRIVFSGDLGRYDSATMLDPTPIRRADWLLVESTYGDRRHDTADPEDVLASAINRAAARGGTVVIPSFAVGRAQTLMYHLRQLKDSRRIPDLPVFLDSPMSIDASELFCHNHRVHKLTAAQARAACSVARYVQDPEESKALDANPMPKVIISASGMATGGRVLHHIKHYAPDPRNMILFAGFQAGGTRGAAMTAGADSVKIHGQYIPIRAEVDNLQMFSAHADADEIMTWLRGFEQPPQEIFVVHGEPAAADTLRHRIAEELGWNCHVPEHGETATLS